MNVASLFSIKDKVAIITGGSRGLGKTIATSFAQAGAHVAIFARDEKRIDEVVEEIQKVAKGSVIGIAGDISSEKDVASLYDEVHTSLGSVDILIANAANINRPRKNTWELSKDTWDQIIEVTLTGTFLTCRLAAADMVEQGSGKIVCIASTSSVISSLGHSPYIAAKGGVMQFVQALALESAPYGVNVNAIGPTFIATEMTQASLDDPERYQAIITQLPLGRPLNPDDLIGACFFLASKASDMVTGQLILVDAGHTIH
jgi:NAD(P)-dependent dehydrogenase (short-subunit alcohol dehydrogenase family)